MSDTPITEKSAPAKASADSVVTSFTPSLMSEQTLREIFVARQPLVDRLVRDIRDATTSGARRHALLVGPRGIGKTHLVSMVYYTVKADAELYGRLRIAWLREEEWSVFSYADLLVRTFRALANEYPDERAELNSFADRLMRLSIDEGETVGEAKLLEWLDGRLLLLIAENFNDLLTGMAEQGQQSLRAFLQNHSRAILVTTSPTLTSDLSEFDAPFYGYFNVTHLKELTREEARMLLTRIAVTVEHDDELAAYLQTDEADRRLRVIETLAGGHPRIWILFSGCMSRKLLDELVPLFVKMLDDLTPYYQERMRALPPQERRIIAYLCEQSGAVPVKEIDEALRLKQNAAALLGKLEEKGYVRKAPEPIAPSVGDRRITYYEMREPLMRLCIEVKENRADPLRLIVEFLRCWFSENDIKERLRSLPAHAAMARRYMEAALERLTEVRLVSSGLIFEGDRYLTAGDARKALESFSRAVDLAPDDATAWFKRGVALGHLGNAAEALECFDRVIALGSDYASTWYNRGVAMWYLERLEDALNSFSRATELNPGYVAAWSNRGIILGRLQRHQEALESLNCAVELVPDDASVWSNRGIILGRLQRHQEALESFDHSLALDPYDSSVWRHRGVALGELACPQEALESFDRALALDSKDASAWYSRAVALEDLNRLADALESYDRAVALQPDDASAWSNRGAILGRLQRLREAVESCDRALALDPNDAFTWHIRGDALGELDRSEEALESFDRALALDPSDASAWYSRGVELGELERTAEALECFDRALNLDPTNASAWHNRGAALGRLERWLEALESVDRALTLEPDDVTGLYNRGLTLESLGRWEEALESFRRAVVIQPDYSSAHSSLAECLAALHRFDEACAELEAALGAPDRDDNGLQSAGVVVLREMLLTPAHRDRWSEWAEAMLSAFAANQSLPFLAYALTQAISALFSETVTDALAQAWLAAWEAVGRDRPQMDVAMRLLRAAAEWRRTRDRGAILRLAAEERTVLEELLPRA